MMRVREMEKMMISMLTKKPIERGRLTNRKTKVMVRGTKMSLMTRRYQRRRGRKRKGRMAARMKMRERGGSRRTRGICLMTRKMEMMRGT